MRAAAEQYLFFSRQDDKRPFDFLDFPLCSGPSGLKASESERVTRTGDGTSWATGPLRQTERCSNLHQRLIEAAWTGWRDEPRGDFMQFSLIGEAKKAGKNTPRVPVQRRVTLIERDAHNGARRVGADSRQSPQAGKIRRDLSTVMLRNGPRGPFQLPGPLVIAQPGPESEDFFHRGAIETSDARNRFHKAPVVRKNRFDLGLLKHGLGNPDRIRIFCPAPGKITVVPVEPTQELAPDMIWIATRHLRFSENPT